MRIALPARRTFITAIIIFFLLYTGYSYVALAVIGLFVLTWFMFPVKQPQDFFSGVISAIDSMAQYLRATIRSIDETTIVFDEHPLIKSFYAPKSTYAEWVFSAGFNPGLRAGYRNFLIQLEHAMDLCCSISYWLSRQMDIANKDDFSSSLANSIKINVDLLTALSRTLQHHAEKTIKPANDAAVDFVNDMVELEEVLKRMVPGSLELLDLSPEYIAATAIVKDVKDLREVLLALIAAVPV